MNDAEQKPSCGTCKHAKVYSDDELRCHRYPPEMSETGRYYPKMFREDWCGEYVQLTVKKSNQWAVVDLVYRSGVYVVETSPGIYLVSCKYDGKTLHIMSTRNLSDALKFSSELIACKHCQDHSLSNAVVKYVPVNQLDPSEKS